MYIKIETKYKNKVFLKNPEQKKRILSEADIFPKRGSFSCGFFHWP